MNHPSELKLERHLLDPARSGIAGHVAECERCRGRLSEMQKQGEDFRRFVYPATLDKVTQPLLVIHGARDGLFPPAQAERIAREAPHATCGIYSVFHRVNDNLFDFLSRPRPPAGQGKMSVTFPFSSGSVWPEDAVTPAGASRLSSVLRTASDETWRSAPEPFKITIPVL